MRITIHLPEPIGEQLEERAKQLGSSQSALVRQALEWYFTQATKTSAIDTILNIVDAKPIPKKQANKIIQGLHNDRKTEDRP